MNSTQTLRLVHLCSETFSHSSTFDHFCNKIVIVQFKKISILSPQKGLEFPRGRGGSLRPKNLKKCMEFDWNFWRGGEDLRKIPSMGGYGYFLELHIV